MKKEYTCFFTGHRLLPEKRTKQIKELIKIKAKNLIENKGVEHFIAGGALGFDTLAAETIINLKESYPHIKLHLYFPCYSQSKRWNYNDKYKWHIIKSKCDDFKYITESYYTSGCMQKRNRKMAEDSFYCIAYCILNKSGTGFTLRHAKMLGIIIDNIAEDIY